MSIASCIVGAGLYVLMFFTFTRYHHMHKIVASYFVLLIMQVFIPVSGVFHAFLFYAIISMMYLFIYRESVYTTAINSFLMFFIHYSSAMIATNIYLLLTGKLVDYRHAFNTSSLGYLVLVTFLFITILYIVKQTLLMLRKHFDVLKERQIEFYGINLAVAFILFIYLRLNIRNAIKIVYFDNFSLNSYMALHLLISVILLIWLVVMTNRGLINSSPTRSKKDGETLDEMVRYAKEKNDPLSMIYLNLPDYGWIVEKYGKSEGQKLLRIVNQVRIDVIPFSVTLPLKKGEMVIVLRSCEESEAWVYLNELDRCLNQALHENNIRFELGISQYNSLAHDDYKAFILSAKGNKRVCC